MLDYVRPSSSSMGQAEEVSQPMTRGKVTEARETPAVAEAMIKAIGASLA